MPFDRFYIGPYNQDGGLQTNVRPFLIAENAFAELNNAYVFRGRVRKRFGSRWFGETQFSSRLRIQVGTTDGAGNTGALNVRTINADATMPTAVGQAFSIGTTLFTVFNSAGGPQQMKRSDGSAAVATYDLNNSAFDIQGADVTTAVFFYPSFPVMGLLNVEESAKNNELAIAFDTRYSYRYISGVGWDRINTEAVAGAAVWTGSNSEFFWGTTWTGANAFEKRFFVTNFNKNEPNFIRVLDPGALTWDNFRPQITDPAGTNIRLNSARILVSFKNRLIALNTWEGSAGASPGNHYPFRARYSRIGSPFNAQDGFRQDIAGRGNAIDAPTTEAIVTVEFIKDRLIVFFERSTWELVYIGNQAYPFVWQQINTELGVESTFSVVPFDKIALGVGNLGIHACNGTNVERIDSKIPDTVFDIHNADQGVERVYGLRDYFTENVYWSFPSLDNIPSFPYPSRVLVYNYPTGTWSLNDDSITVFGYFQPQTGTTWDSSISWDSSTLWDSGALQIQFRQIVAGNQEGYTFVIERDIPFNAPVLQITDLTIGANNVITITTIDHNLRNGDFVFLQDITGTGNLTTLNNRIYKVIDSPITNNTPNTFQIQFDDDAGTVIAGTYNGAGVIARVSKISIRTKEYNFYANQGKNAYVGKVDFLVDKTSVGEIEIDYTTSSAVGTSMIDESNTNGTNALLGSGNLETSPYATVPFESRQDRLWHPVYLQAEGEYVQLHLFLNDTQMTTRIGDNAPFSYPALEDFQMHSMIIYAEPISRLE